MTDEPDGNPRAERREADPINRSNGEPKRTRRSGKGPAALMLLLGLLLGTLVGGVGALFAPRTGVLEDLPELDEPVTPPSFEPRTVTRIVEVDKPVTPQECLAALDDLIEHRDDLSGIREQLMKADLARVSGDSDVAESGLAEVDRRLRALVIAGSSRSLQSAIQTCRSKGNEQGASPSPSPSPSPSLSPTDPAPSSTDSPPEPVVPSDLTSPEPPPPA
jgi:hypothetical protein